METAPKYSSPCISIVKIITTVLFIVLPFLGFFLGVNYQASVTESQEVPTPLVRKPTPSPKQGIAETANWKTYENKKLKFELKYPDKNSEVIECESETIFIAPIERHFDPCQSSGGRFWIRAEEINYKLPDWYYRDYNIQTQKVLIASREATKYAGTRSSKEIAPIPQSFYAIVIKTEERTIVINVQTYTGSQTLNDRLIDQILSTFKFADQNQIDETSNWKTYTNEKYGFEFKYLPDWEKSENSSSITLKTSDTNQDKVELPGDTFDDADYSITISIKNNPSQYPLDEYLNKIENYAELSRADQVIIAGITGKKLFVGAAPSSGLDIVIYIPNKDKVYSFTYHANAHPDTHEKYVNIFDQILSTFKFTN